MTTEQTPAPAEKQVRPFADFLLEQNRGRTHSELSDLLNELVSKVADTGKKGSVTLVVEVKPAGKGDHHTVLVTDKVTAKLPNFDRQESIFYITSEGNLTRTDPRQMHLPLRGVPGGEAPAEDIEPPADAAGSATT